MIYFYTIPEVATYFKVSEATVRSWVLYGKISYQKIGNSVRFTEEDLMAFSKRKEAVK